MTENIESTITVVYLLDHPQVLQMTWHPKPTRKDTQDAFELVLQALDDANAPVNIIVNIQRNPSFPLLETIHGAKGVQSHTMMGQWLVIGANGLARVIARSIKILRQDNIQWFDTEDQVMQYLKKEAGRDSL